MPASTKIRETLLTKRQEAAAAWAEFEPFQKAVADGEFDPATDADKFNEAHEKSKAYGLIADECKELEARYEKALEMDGIMAPDNPLDRDRRSVAEVRAKSPGQRFVESDEYQELKKKSGDNFEGVGVALKVAGLSRADHIMQLMSRFDMKTLLSSGNVDDPADPGAQLLRPQRLPGYLELLQAPLKLRNLISIGATDNNTVEWVRQTAVMGANPSGSAAEVSEATDPNDSSGTKPEGAMAFDVQHTVVQTIAHWIPATTASLADMAQLRTIVDTQLLDGVARRLNSQILKGNGMAPNLLGILAHPIQAQDDTVQGASGARKLERVLAAITKIRLAFIDPTAILIHPNDYEFIRLAKNDLADYYMGRPAIVGEDTLWGLPLIQDVTVDEGEPVVGDWSQAILYVREDVMIAASDSHNDFFTRNLVAIRGEGRYAVTVPRPDAFCTVDFDTAETTPS